MNEGKKSYKDPKRTVKPRNPVMPNMQSTGAGAHKDKKKNAKHGVVKHKKQDYFEHLETLLDDALTENRDMKNWDQTPGRIMPAEEAAAPSIKVRREQDEWVVSIKGTFVRIPVEDAPSPEDAVKQAKHNLRVAEAREMTPALRAAQQNLIALKQASGKKVDAKTSVQKRPPENKPKATPVQVSKKEPAVIAKGGQVHDPEMEKMLAAFLAKGGEIKKGKPGKAPPTGRNQASLHIGGVGSFKKKSDKPGLGAKYRGEKDVAVEGWTHDTLAAQLFEQDLSYEDELNRMLKRKLGK